MRKIKIIKILSLSPQLIYEINAISISNHQSSCNSKTISKIQKAKKINVILKINTIVKLALLVR